MTLTELLDSGELEGYLAEAPTGGLISGAEIDRQVAASAACSKCKHQGLEYHPFRVPGISYRAFAVCPTAVRRTSSAPPHSSTPSPAGRRRARAERTHPWTPTQ